MVRLQISVAHSTESPAKLPACVGFENKRAANGDWFIWLDHATVAKLKALRAPSEDWSDVIIRITKG